MSQDPDILNPTSGGLSAPMETDQQALQPKLVVEASGSSSMETDQQALQPKLVVEASDPFPADTSKLRPQRWK